MIRTDGTPTICTRPNALEIEMEIVRMERERLVEETGVQPWQSRFVAELHSDDPALD